MCSLVGFRWSGGLMMCQLPTLTSKLGHLLTWSWMIAFLLWRHRGQQASTDAGSSRELQAFPYLNNLGHSVVARQRCDVDVQITFQRHGTQRHQADAQLDVGKAAISLPTSASGESTGVVHFQELQELLERSIWGCIACTISSSSPGLRFGSSWRRTGLPCPAA